MVMSFKAGNHLRFAEALLAISIYANAFTADAQGAPDIVSTSASASATPTLKPARAGDARWHSSTGVPRSFRWSV
jgi:hypothetical protein